MNEDTFEGKWKQAKGQIKQWWGDLTDDDLKQIEGSRDKLVGKLQERYGYSRQRADDEVNHRFNEYEKQNRP